MQGQDMHACQDQVQDDNVVQDENVGLGYVYIDQDQDQDDDIGQDDNIGIRYACLA